MTATEHTLTTRLTQRQPSRPSPPYHIPVGEDLHTWMASHHARMQRHCAEKIAYHERMAQFHEEQIMYYTDKLRSYHLKTAAALPSVERDVERQYEISDAQWEEIAPLLTLGSGLGRPYADTRRTLNGILYVLRTKCGWRNMPKQYGSYVTCWRRLTRWQAKGIWKQIEQIVTITEETENIT